MSLVALGWIEKIGGGDLPSGGLRGEEGARRVDFQPALPLRGRHVDGVRAPHHPGEAAQDVHAAQLRSRKRDRGPQLLRVRDVHLDREHRRAGELRLERLDLRDRFRVV